MPWWSISLSAPLPLPSPTVYLLEQGANGILPNGDSETPLAWAEENNMKEGKRQERAAGKKKNERKRTEKEAL